MTDDEQATFVVQRLAGVTCCYCGSVTAEGKILQFPHTFFPPRTWCVRHCTVCKRIGAAFLVENP